MPPNPRLTLFGRDEPVPENEGVGSPTPKVLGVLAGRDLAPGALSAWLAWADRVVAADGGADLCRAAGREPDAIVGDLDSIADPSGLVRDEDQDTSDADKLLAHLEREGVAEATLIGVEGDRLDHVLGTLYSCARSPLGCRLALRAGAGFVRKAFTVEAWHCAGRISLMPLGRCRVSLKGVVWPLHHAVLEPLGLVSLSNEVLDERLELVVHEGVAALFLSDGPLPKVGAMPSRVSSGSSGAVNL